jgi:alkylation response protein AidB-like acyl-CoA dehydrogenase
VSVFHFELRDLPPEAEAFRDEVRVFLREALGTRPAVRRARSWGGFDPEFSRKLGARGWIGLTWPKKYGGQERSFLERYVLLEELLAAGAPAGAHWVAERQSGPLLLRFGTEAQRERFLPAIRARRAVVRHRHERAGLRLRPGLDPHARGRKDGGYVVNGTKVWTSNAHRSQYAIALFRTAVVPDKKHEGLSQFLVDLKSPGITIRPIINLAGSHDFNEVVFQDAFVPEDMRVGGEGDGWKQVTTELAFERSGPERYLSSIALILSLIDHVGADPIRARPRCSAASVAQLMTLRQMSLSVAGMLQAGQNPNLEAAVVKDVGTTFEQSVPEVVHALMDIEPTIDTGGDLQQTLGYLVQRAPSFSLRGGTREVLRGIIARGLGLR